jgi:hypothetical protein
MGDDKLIRCDCGYHVRGTTEQQQVVEMRRHAWRAHRISFSPEEVLVILLRLELESGESEPARLDVAPHIERRGT